MLVVPFHFSFGISLLLGVPTATDRPIVACVLFCYSSGFCDFVSDGAWNIAEPILEDLSSRRITCLHAMGQEMWAASAGNIFKLILKVHSDDAVTVDKVVCVLRAKTTG